MLEHRQLLHPILKSPTSPIFKTLSRKEKKKLSRQRKLTLHHLRKERHISSKSRESPSPEDKRGISVDRVGFWQHAAPGHQ
eukprot:970794-Pelagomonas_calceolata.AAC.1